MAGKGWSMGTIAGGGIRANRGEWGGEDMHAGPNPTENPYPKYTKNTCKPIRKI